MAYYLPFRLQTVAIFCLCSVIFAIPRYLGIGGLSEYGSKLKIFAIYFKFSTLGAVQK